MLRAAFGKFDTTPPTGIRMGRLGVNIHLAEGVEWPLYLRAALFDDGRQRVATVVLDQGFVSAGVTALLREAVQNGAQVAPECCMVSTTHTHNAPALMPWRDEDEGFDFAISLAKQLQNLAQQLAERLAPVRLQIAQTSAPGWSWNRRAIYRDADQQTWVGTHGERGGDDFVGMEGADEDTLRVLIALREDGSAMGGMVNFWCHPTTMYGAKVWTADFPGPLLHRLQAHFGGDFVYLTGPCGDLSNNGGMSDGVVRSGSEYCQSMGEALAARAITALENATPLAGDTVGASREVLTLAQRMITPQQVKTARDYIAQQRKPTLQPSLMQRLYDWPFHMKYPTAAMDEWLAIEVLGMWEWQKRAAVPQLCEDAEVQTLSLGELALVALPCELFSELGRDIVRRSPHPHTWPVELANGYFGYVPTPAAFAHGGYECCIGWQSRLEAQAGPQLVEAALRLLNRIPTIP